MTLRLFIEGANTDELARGLAAAEAVFERSAVSYNDAVDATLAGGLWEMTSFPQDAAPSEDVNIKASVWYEADRAACEACCAGWPEDKAVEDGALGIGAGEPKAKTANPVTWPERQKLYPSIIERLETAGGPDRQLDIDICYVMGWITEPGTPEAAAELGLPFLTSNLADVAAITQKSLKGWTIEIDQTPCDARIIEPEPNEGMEYDSRSAAAWRHFDGRLHMDKPPANTAIALTLAAMRLQDESFLGRASW